MLKRLSGYSTVALLVTSRTLSTCGHAAHVDLQALHLVPAVELLQEKWTLPSELWQPDVAKQVAELCGCNALCLQVVGSFISAGRSTLQVRGWPRQ